MRDHLHQFYFIAKLCQNVIVRISLELLEGRVVVESREQLDRPH
jgi:hypothetical protein